MMEQAFAVLNYVVIGLVLMYITLDCMRDVHVPKRSLTVGLIYFAFKFLVDTVFYSRQGDLSDGMRLAGFAWGMLTLCLSFPVCKLLFWGNSAGLYISFAAINSILSAVQLVSFSLTNWILGKPLSAPFRESYGIGTVLTIVILMVVYLALRKPLVWMATGLQHFPHRYQVVVAELIFFATTGFLFTLYQPALDEGATSIIGTYWRIILFSVIPLLVIALLQIRMSGKAYAQTIYMQQIEELTNTYKARISAQLAIAERDRMLFDGLGAKLESLGAQSGSLELLEQVAQLEDEYERIVRGIYCDNPVYDAFLCALAGRLEDRGVHSHFSVVALAPMVRLRPQLVLILLSEVDRMAARARVWWRALRSTSGYDRIKA